MKPNELRTGHWVVVKPFSQEFNGMIMTQSNPQICEVTSIHKLGDSTFVFVNDNILAAIPIEDVFGVPLTEDILNRAGFRRSFNEYGNTFHIMEDNGFVVKYTIEHWTNTNSEIYKGRFHADKIGKIESVHQVQDALFLFFGQELDFSFLRCANVTMNFIEGNCNPVGITIETQEE